MTDADEDGRGDLYVDTAAGIVAGSDCDDSNDALYAFTECEKVGTFKAFPLVYLPWALLMMK